jgi:hypothetical protein
VSRKATTKQLEALEAFRKHGSWRAAGRALGLNHASVKELAQKALAAEARAKQTHGQVRIADTNPAPSGVRTYLLSYAQNNTRVHGPFLRNLEAYAAYLNAEIRIARGCYNVAAYGQLAVKPGQTKGDKNDELWFDPAIAPYVCDDKARHGSCRWRLAPDLLWCAEMQIDPTAVRPLSGLDAYAGESSGIFPHAKIALESLPRVAGREPKFNFTTGAVTQRNYIQKKAGIKAEFHHAYGALLVEVDADGNWWARHINATNDGSFYDLTRRVRNGRVSDGHRVEAINWGDVHASEIDADVRELNWGAGGVIDTLRPRYQFMHDLFSMRSRSHHEAKSYEARLLKAGTQLDSVEEELRITAQLLDFARRPFCETVVVSSNHDRHGERWLDEADYKQDLPNAEFFLEAQLARTRALRSEGRWQFLSWALAERWGCPDRFLKRDEPFIICAKSGRPVSCGSHGDEGPDGARGSTGNLIRLSIRQNKGHDHKLTIRDGVASAGACARTFNYCHGPSSHSVSHLMTYRNGKRAGITQRAGKCWR